MGFPAGRRGAVLIIVLGVLFILAVLATSFVTLSITERSISRNYLDLVRAKLMSQSGVETAMAHLGRIGAQDFFPDPGRAVSPAWIYFGNELDERNRPQLDAPVETARNPSYAQEDELVQNPADDRTTPRQIVVRGRSCGLSGVVGGTYCRNGDLFSLKVQDLSGRIHVNDGLDQSNGNKGPVSQNLRRILNRLGDAVECPALGDLIVEKRPSTGYRNRQELEAALGDAAYRKVQNFLTTTAWVDPNVALPVPLSATALANDYPVKDYFRGVPPVYRYGRGVDAYGKRVVGDLVGHPTERDHPFENAVYALDELNPQWIELVSRAPVNVNQAAREVLIALLADLQGYFMSFRRRNNIEPGNIGMYWFHHVVHTYSPEGLRDPLNVPNEGDEYGFLYKTAPIRAKSRGTVVEGEFIDAGAIADQIIACRERRGDYAQMDFGGPFRSWRQFYAFCDHLARVGVLEDKRRIFYDYKPNGAEVIVPGNITGYAPLVTSDYQRELGTQALADVLKANFNPNLHLNELNPDTNLHLLVDKTDLIANSTEFVFTPTGYFEIESLGRVLRAEDGMDALTARNNQVLAEHKTRVGVQLFELRRESTQADFMRGTLPPRQGHVRTNTNASLEIGPEVDSGPAPLENDWGGYVALTTVGGTGKKKERGEYGHTPPGPRQYGETIGVPFQWDYVAAYHQDGVREELAQVSKAEESVFNFPDPSEGYGGPYDPVHGNPGRHRLARSFRMPTAGSQTKALPNLFMFAPMDLRVDGAYVERHASPAWWISRDSFVPNIRQFAVTASMWIKPSFPPPRSGKPRLILNADRWTERVAAHAGGAAYFTFFFNAGHETPPMSGPTPTEHQTVYSELQWSNRGALYYGYLPFRPQAFIFGRGYGPNMMTGVPRYYANVSTIVNHEGHNDGLKSTFRDHRWTHVIVIARPRPGHYLSAASTWFSSIQPEYNRILVNGRQLPGTLESYLSHDSNNNNTDANFDWTIHATGERNSVRFGAPSSFVRGPIPARNNFSTDSTIDEFYLWNSDTNQAQQNAALGWLLGRYYKPLHQSGVLEEREGVFTSGEIGLSAQARGLPSPSRAVPPGERVTATGTTVAMTVAQETEVLGLSWTVFGEEAGNTSLFVTDGETDRQHAVKVDLYLKAGSDLLGPFTDDGFSEVSLRLGERDRFRYLAHFQIDDLGIGTVLLSTPVLDDVTIYYRSVAKSRFVYWISDMAAK